MSDPTDPTDDRLDRGLDTLFAPARPGFALEADVIARLRTVPVRRPLLAGWKARAAVGVAASVGLGLTGFVASAVAHNGGLPLPGDPNGWAMGTRSVTFATGAAPTGEAAPTARDFFGLGMKDGADEPDRKEDLTNPDMGLEPELPRAVEVDNLLELNVMKDVVPDQPPGRESTDATKPVDVTLRSGATRSGPAGAGVAGGEARFGRTRERTWESPNANGRLEPFWQTIPGETKLTGDRGNVALGLVAEQEVRAKNAPAAGDVPAAKPPAVALADPAAPPAAEAPAARKVIRSGEIEFEVDAFDPAAAAVTKLVAAIPGAFVGTVNSDKLPNGKVKGTLAVRVPPDHLDGLLLDLRRDVGKTGELKGVRVGSQDVTKHYTDMESRLRAARTMEQRLLQIIKDGKGEIKQLLEAERELGVWRTKIEEYEGDLRYHANLIALSTLTVTLTERDLKAAAGVTETERVQAGIEVDDVDQMFRAASAAVAEAKGRVTKSELKQPAPGQFTAVLHFEVAPEAANSLRDRLAQLGRVARMDVDRVQQPQGSGEVQKGAPVKRGDAQFQIGFYNLANVAPRETATVRVAVPKVAEAYQALRDAAGKANARVLVAQVSEHDAQNVTAQLDVEIRRADEGAFAAALAAAGDAISRTVTRNPDGLGVTDAKVQYRTTLVAADRLKPRETATLAVEVADPDRTAAAFTGWVQEAKGRVADAQVTRDPSGRETARLAYTVPLPTAGGLVEKFKAAGTVRVQQSARDPQATEGRFALARLDVTLTTADRIVPSDEGLSAQVRRGLAVSAQVLLASVTWVIFGLCVVLPWALVGWAAYRLLRPRRAAVVPAPVAATAPPG